VAGAFVYPLVLKCRLAQLRLYSLNEEDVAGVLWLEKLLDDRPFFEIPVEPAPPAGPDELVDVPLDQSTPDARAMPDEAQVRLTRWQRQVAAVNDALLGLALSGFIGELHESGPGDVVPAPDRN